jgi:hypothetical protein
VLDIRPDASAFFCSKCHGVVNPGAVRAPARREAASVAAATGGRSDAAPSSYVSRYEGTAPRDASGPGAGFSAGGSLIGGLVLAATAAAVAGGGLAWVSAHVVRVPLLVPILVGWLVRRAFAIGGGGGTPDRGFVGGAFLLAICLGAFGIGLYVQYAEADQRESKHARLVFGEATGAGAFDEASRHLASLRATDASRAGEVDLEDGTTIDLADETMRLDRARATGQTPRSPYDLVLLAETGSLGFSGWFKESVTHGLTFRFLPSQAGWDLPGAAMAALWFVEFLLLGLVAFSRVD